MHDELTKEQLRSKIEYLEGSLKAVMDSRNTAIDAWAEKCAATEKERDEADRRAGAAERKITDVEDTLHRLQNCRDKQKQAAGYHRNESFDKVWAETLAKAKSAEIHKIMAEQAEQTYLNLAKDFDNLDIPNMHQWWKVTASNLRMSVREYRAALKRNEDTK